ncbi:MAG: type II toxin-antitoxin system RelE/ParE family toxin [Synergistaceae bacterium]
MGWKVEFSRNAEKELSSLDRPEALRIVKYLADLTELENPRSRGKALVADLSGLWRYRVGHGVSYAGEKTDGFLF